MLANKFYQINNIDDTKNILRKAINLSKTYKLTSNNPDGVDFSALPFLKTLSLYATITSSKNADTRLVNERLSNIIDRQSIIAKNTFDTLNISAEDQAKQQTKELLNQTEITQLTESPNFEAMMNAQLQDSGIQIPKELMDKIGKDSSTSLPGMEKQFQSMMKNMQTGGINMDDMPDELKNSMQETNLATHYAYNKLKKQRNYYDNQRKFELGVAEVYLAFNKTAKANEWLSKMNIREQYVYLSNSVLAYDAYVKALYASQTKNMDEASRRFQQAVNYWYFAPKSAVDTLRPIFPSSTYILEAAANHELEQQNLQKSIGYIELARGASLENPALYGYLDKTGMKKLQENIEKNYAELELIARKKLRSPVVIKNYFLI